MGRVVGKYTHEKAHGTQAALNFPTPRIMPMRMIK